MIPKDLFITEIHQIKEKIKPYILRTPLISDGMKGTNVITDYYLHSILLGNENPKKYEHHLAISIGWKIFHNWKKGFKKKKEQKPCFVF